MHIVDKQVYNRASHRVHADSSGLYRCIAPAMAIYPTAGVHRVQKAVHVLSSPPADARHETVGEEDS
eukprot:6094950-Prymnesium_polylepis.2